MDYKLKFWILFCCASTIYGMDCLETIHSNKLNKFSFYHRTDLIFEVEGFEFANDFRQIIFSDIKKTNGSIKSFWFVILSFSNGEKIRVEVLNDGLILFCGETFSANEHLLDVLNSYIPKETE